MHTKDVEEMEKPFVLVVGFFFHITIAINEGWLAPRYLLHFRCDVKMN